MMGAAATHIQPLEASTAPPGTDRMLSADRVKSLLDAGSELVDARSEGEFVGLYTGGKEERPGTIPGSHHQPHDRVTQAGSALLPRRYQIPIGVPGRMANERQRDHQADVESDQPEPDDQHD